MRVKLHMCTSIGLYFYPVNPYVLTNNEPIEVSWYEKVVIFILNIANLFVNSSFHR